MRRLSICTTLALVAGVQVACTTNVVVEGSVPTPLIEKVPIRVGIYYSDSFKSYEHKEKLPEAGHYRIPLGEKNLMFFRNLTDALFLEVVELEEPRLAATQQEHLDAILIPEIVKYGFLVPAVSTLTFYEASIEYELTLTARDGGDIGSWKVVGYGKAEAAMFGGREAVGEATMQAIRDGGARIATEVSPEMIAKLASPSAPDAAAGAQLGACGLRFVAC